MKQAGRHDRRECTEATRHAELTIQPGSQSDRSFAGVLALVADATEVRLAGGAPQHVAMDHGKDVGCVSWAFVDALASGLWSGGRRWLAVVAHWIPKPGPT